jgi:hypothetical protein
MVPNNNQVRVPLQSSTSIGIKAIKPVGLSYPDNHQGIFFILGYEYIPNFVAHMVSLEVLIHLRRSFPFSK